MNFPKKCMVGARPFDVATDYEKSVTNLKVTVTRQTAFILNLD